MTKTEFYERYCEVCGTQRCGGVEDTLFREGCSHYKKEFSNESKDTYSGKHIMKLIDADILYKKLCCDGKGNRIPFMDCDGFKTMLSVEEVSRTITHMPIFEMKDNFESR